MFEDVFKCIENIAAEWGLDDETITEMDEDFIMNDRNNGEPLENYILHVQANTTGTETFKNREYYKRNDVEVIEVIKLIYQFFGDDLTSLEAACFYNIIKYLMRYKYKGSSYDDLVKVLENVEWLRQEAVK